MNRIGKLYTVASIYCTQDSKLIFQQSHLFTTILLQVVGYNSMHMYAFPFFSLLASSEKPLKI